MKECTSCGNKRRFFLNGKKASCLRCDELLYDLEIECEEEEKSEGEAWVEPMKIAA